MHNEISFLNKEVKKILFAAGFFFGGPYSTNGGRVISFLFIRIQESMRPDGIVKNSHPGGAPEEKTNSYISKFAPSGNPEKND